MSRNELKMLKPDGAAELSNGPPDPLETRREVARAAEQERKAREEACLKEVNTVLEKYHCMIAAKPEFVPAGGAFQVATRISVVAQ